MVFWIPITTNFSELSSLHIYKDKLCAMYDYNKNFKDKLNYAYSLILILWTMERFLQRKTSCRLHVTRSAMLSTCFSFRLLKLCFHSCFTTKQLWQWHSHVYQEDNFHKFYIHDYCVQLQYAAQGVMDHWNASYHILMLEFGMYHISSYTDSYPVVLYPSCQWVYFHCNIIHNTDYVRDIIWNWEMSLNI
jgi:hypothetical protein